MSMPLMSVAEMAAAKAASLALRQATLSTSSVSASLAAATTNAHASHNTSSSTSCSDATLATSTVTPPQGHTRIPMEQSMGTPSVHLPIDTSNPSVASRASLSPSRAGNQIPNKPSAKNAASSSSSSTPPSSTPPATTTALSTDITDVARRGFSNATEGGNERLSASGCSGKRSASPIPAQTGTKRSRIPTQRYDKLTDDELHNPYKKCYNNPGGNTNEVECTGVQLALKECGWKWKYGSGVGDDDCVYKAPGCDWGTAVEGITKFSGKKAISKACPNSNPNDDEFPWNSQDFKIIIATAQFVSDDALDTSSSSCVSTTAERAILKAAFSSIDMLDGVVTYCCLAHEQGWHLRFDDDLSEVVILADGCDLDTAVEGATKYTGYASLGQAWNTDRARNFEEGGNCSLIVERADKVKEQAANQASTLSSAAASTGARPSSNATSPSESSDASSTSNGNAAGSNTPNIPTRGTIDSSSSSAMSANSSTPSSTKNANAAGSNAPSLSGSTSDGENADNFMATDSICSLMTTNSGTTSKGGGGNAAAATTTLAAAREDEDCLSDNSETLSFDPDVAAPRRISVSSSENTGFVASVQNLFDKAKAEISESLKKVEAKHRKTSDSLKKEKTENKNLQAKLIESSNACRTLEEEKGALNEEKLAEQERSEALQSEKERMEQELVQSKELLSAKTAEKGNLARENQNQKNKLSNARKEMATLKRKHDKLMVEKKTLKEKLKDEQKSSAAAKGALEKEKGGRRQDAERFKREINEIKAKVYDGQQLNIQVAGTSMTRSPGGEDEDEKAKMRGKLDETIVREDPKVKWEDVAGLERAKESLKEAIILPVTHKHLFKGKRRPAKGILLYGPPGTGKTLLAKAVATESDAVIFCISAADIFTKWQGDSEKLVKELFEMASEQEGGKAIIFIDEIDSLCGSRSNGDDNAERRVKNQFLQQMDGLLTNDNNDILVLGATNLPWEIDLAMRRRLAKRVYISLPDEQTRAEMIKLHMGDTPNDLAESDFRSLGEITDGASGSDIRTMVQEALMEPIRNGQKAKQFLRVSGHFFPCEQSPNCALCPAEHSSGPRSKDCQSCGATWTTFSDVPPEDLMVADVKVKDFRNVMTSSYSSASPEELKKYDDWTKDFGKDGS